MEAKHIEVKDLDTLYSDSFKGVVLDNCDIEGCDNIEQIESILNNMHFFGNYEYVKDHYGKLLEDIYLLTHDDKPTGAVYFVLTPNVELTRFPVMFTARTGMDFMEPSVYQNKILSK